jgi:hypothetical protein
MRNKLIFSVSFLLIAGFLATSFASYYVSRASLRRGIRQNELPLTSDNVFSEIQNDLLQPVVISSFMAADTFLRDWAIGGELDERKITQYLKEMQRRYNAFTSFFVSEKTRIYYHTAGILKKVSPDEERDTWYFRVREMKSDYEINVDPDMANRDTLTIFINYRVFDYEGNFIGVTGVGLKVSSVKALIETYQRKYNRQIYLIDENGEIMLSGSGFDPEIHNIQQLEHHDQFGKHLDPRVESSFTYTKSGSPVHVNTRFVDGLQWYLVVEQSETETTRQIFKILLTNLFICILITLVVVLLVNLSVMAYQKRIETLRGIVPICSYCKQIRDDKGYWNQIEAYIRDHSEAEFSHSICPQCASERFPDMKIYDDRKTPENRTGPDENPDTNPEAK